MDPFAYLSVLTSIVLALWDQSAVVYLETCPICLISLTQRCYYSRTAYRVGWVFLSRAEK